MIGRTTLAVNLRHAILLLSLLLFLSASYATHLKSTLALETANACNFTRVYSDKGSGGDDDLGIHTPQVPAGYYMIGDYAQGDDNSANQCIPVVKPTTTSSGNAAKLLAPPVNWHQVWTDKGSGADMNGSVWHAIPPDSNYVCIGSVGRTGYDKPSLPKYRCVHKCLVENVDVPNYLWSDRGTGADTRISIYTLKNSGLFFAVPKRGPPTSLMDLKTRAVCTGNLDTMTSTPSGTTTKPATPPPTGTNVWKNPDLQ